jgi:TM2 domain-containing membrane protein YozV
MSNNLILIFLLISTNWLWLCLFTGYRKGVKEAVNDLKQNTKEVAK